ncbi:MAG: hypothetical protein EP298_05860 [Gammaproteobacteria bacterium]|nr:MAG: hypothetical protein EP298_05860 [Gammaproteobacteria bacterium]UTW41419.1 hypothetical protein KFE69_07805 [bacterium SCSIO 12844]
MNIIPAMKALGYHPDDDGVCYGISHMGTQALLRGDFATFQKRMKLIHSLTKTELLNKIVKAETKRFLKQPLSKKDNLLLSIKPFFDGISVYQNDFNDTDIAVKKNIHPMFDKQDYHVGNQLYNGDSSEGVYTAAKALKVFNKQSLAKFFTLNETDMLEAHMEPEPSVDGYERIGGEKKDVLVYNIGNKDHIVTVAFDQKQWHLIDHDTVWSGTDKNILAKKVIESLQEGRSRDIVVYMEENTSKSTDHKKLAVEHPEISTTKSAREAGKLLSMAANEKMYDIASKYLTDIIAKYKSDRNFHHAIGSNSKVVDHFFYKMLTTGDHKTLQAYVSKVNASFSFDYDDKQAIFNPKSTAIRTKAIYNALNNNYDQALKAYLDGINQSCLSLKQRQTQILASFSSSDIVELFNTSKVNSKTMAVSVDALSKLQLTMEQREQLPQQLKEALPPIPVSNKNPGYGTFTTQPPKIFASAPKSEEVVDRSVYYL